MMFSEHLSKMSLFILLIVFGETIGDKLMAPIRPSSSVNFLSQSYPSCYTEGRTWSTDEAMEFQPRIPTPYACQDLCLGSPDCHKFTWYDGQGIPINFVCFLFDQTTTEVPCTNCVSGPQACNCQIPEPQNHGDWFCPPNSDPTTCHLECHPGFVSDSETALICDNGEWSAGPNCVEAVALITGSYNYPYEPSKSVEIYGEGLHKKLPDLPGYRYGHSLDVVNSVVMLCGGHNYRHSCISLTSAQEWIPHSTTSSVRMSHSSAPMLGKLHLLGGWVTSPTSTTEVLQAPSDRWNPSWDLIEDNYGSCSAKISPELLIMTGGGTNPGSENFNSVNVVEYNVTNGAATRLKDLITPRGGHGCVYVKNSETAFRGVLVAGGGLVNNGGDGSSSEMFDIKSGEWFTTGDLTTRRQAGVKMIVLGKNILAMGGHDGSVTLTTVDKFNFTSMQWTTGENMLEMRKDHGVTGVPPNAVGIFY